MKNLTTAHQQKKNNNESRRRFCMLPYEPHRIFFGDKYERKLYMKIIKPLIKFTEPIDGKAMLNKLENCARVCYQSTSNNDNSEKFIANIIKKGHESVLEHVSITFNVITARSVSHEWVRHRIASYSQESTRYVKYDNDNMEFIEPIELVDTEGYNFWKRACLQSENAYINMMKIGHKAQEARAVLNNSLKTQLCVTMNFRSLRNFLQLRCDKTAHPHIKQLAIPLLLYLQQKVPVVFDDIKYDEVFYNSYLSDDRWKEYIVTPLASPKDELGLYDVILDFTDIQLDTMLSATKRADGYMSDSIELMNRGYSVTGKINELRYTPGYSTAVFARTCDEAIIQGRKLLVPLIGICVYPDRNIIPPKDIASEKYEEQCYGVISMGDSDYVYYQGIEEDKDNKDPKWRWIYHPTADKWYAFSINVDTNKLLRTMPTFSYDEAKTRANVCVKLKFKVPMNEYTQSSKSDDVNQSRDEHVNSPGYYFIGNKKVMLDDKVDNVVPYLANNVENKK